MSDVLKREAEQLFLAVSGHLAQPFVDSQPASIQSDVCYPHGRLFERCTEALLAFLKRLHEPFLFRDVAPATDAANNGAARVADRYRVHERIDRRAVIAT